MIVDPRLRLYEKRLGLEVGVVDAFLVRNQIDVEFTNGTTNLQSNSVPKGKAWIGQDAPGSPELKFWSIRNAVECKLMRDGLKAEEAFDKARRVEILARQEIFHRGEHLYLENLGVLQDWKVYLVNGKLVRNQMYVDFTLGGHGYRYCFIPRSEIWIDNAVVLAERPYIKVHEGVEVVVMVKTPLQYDAAHAEATRVEVLLRGGQRVLP